MPLSCAAAFAVLTFALIGGGFAAEPTVEAAPGGRTAVQVGPAVEDPEKDSFGFVGDAHDECGLVPFFSRDAVFHGPRTGDPEKDSLGLRVTGQYDSCAGTIR